MKINEISVQTIRQTVSRLCIEANRHLPDDIVQKINSAKASETYPLAAGVLNDLQENLSAADILKIPICQDTGMAVIFLEIGQDVHFTGGSLYDAIQSGVRDGYETGLLRKSVVSDPLDRVNTGDNTPAVIHTSITDGDAVKITVAPKGFGSENMSALKMLTPFDGKDGVMKFVIDTVKNASGNPCPPMVVGVGIGGDFEQCALLAKKALCRDTNIPNRNPMYAKMEEQLLGNINALGIGPQGFGGVTTALAVNIETAPTHIAGLPVAVNIGCHVTRHKSAVIR